MKLNRFKPFIFMDKTEASGASNFDASGLPEWDFSALYTGMDDPKFEKDFKRAEASIAEFGKAYKTKLIEVAASCDKGLSEKAEFIAKAIKNYEDLSDVLGGLMTFAYLNYAQCATDMERVKFLGDTQERLNRLVTETLFFELELNRIDTDIMDQLLNEKELEFHAPWLIDIRREKPYQLSDELEQLFTEKSATGAQSWNRLFDETMASLKFEIEGEQLPLEGALNLLSSSDVKVRKAASEELSRVLSENSRLLTHITNVMAKDKSISDKWRGFEDIAASRHLSNRVEAEVVAALETAVVKSYPSLSHRYYKIKAKMFGVEQLDHWDRNAPLPNVEESLIEWDEAKQIVLDAFSKFSPKMAEITEMFFDKGWIDAKSRGGKSPGAFAHPCVPSKHPFVLINYMGKPRDVMTLAHELGHGVHQYLANEQGALKAPTPLTLAETASVFGEMLTFRSLLEKVSNKEEKRILLASKIEDMLATVVRQISFYSFERKVHSARKKGELTAEQLGQFWLEVSQESAGDAVKFHEGFEVFWSYIPHFIHAPFYVYAYAFGDCLVNSLYAKFVTEPDGFQDKYFDLLSAGGSKHHGDLLAPFGLDASDENFWDLGLNAIAELIDELESLDD